MIDLNKIASEGVTKPELVNLLERGLSPMDLLEVSKANLFHKFVQEVKNRNFRNGWALFDESCELWKAATRRSGGGLAKVLDNGELAISPSGTSWLYRVDMSDYADLFSDVWEVEALSVSSDPTLATMDLDGHLNRAGNVDYRFEYDKMLETIEENLVEDSNWAEFTAIDDSLFARFSGDAYGGYATIKGDAIYFVKGCYVTEYGDIEGSIAELPYRGEEKPWYYDSMYQDIPWTWKVNLDNIDGAENLTDAEAREMLRVIWEHI